MSACRRRSLPALDLIASFFSWTKVSPPLITCPSVGYFARYSEKNGAYSEWDTLYYLLYPRYGPLARFHFIRPCISTDEIHLSCSKYPARLENKTIHL